MHFLSQFPTLFNFDTGIGNFGIYAIRLNWIENILKEKI